MEDVDRLFVSIESRDFSAEANLASGLDLFTRILEEHPAVKGLRERVQSDPKLAAVLTARIERLRTGHQDPAYENPMDAAIAAYLFCLATARLDESPVSLARTLASTPKLFWAARLASVVLSRHVEVQLT